MIAGMYQEEFAAYMTFGIILNFVFSILFGMYLSKNIGMQEMMESRGEKQQSMLITFSLFIPYVKMLITLYRVAILQFYFLNKGRTHKEFWVYMTNED